jgi:hypothetical protein
LGRLPHANRPAGIGDVDTLFHLVAL